MKETADEAVAAAGRGPARRRRRSRWAARTRRGTPRATSGGTSSLAVERGPVRDRAPGSRAPAVHRVHERDDRQAEGRRPRPRRVPGQDRRGGRVPDRRAAGRPPVLVRRPRLDHGAVGDRRRHRARRDGVPVRRRARPPRARPALVDGRAAPHHAPRRLAHARARADPVRRGAGAVATTCRRCGSSPRPASRGTRSPTGGSPRRSARAGCRSSTCRAGPRSARASCRPTRSARSNPARCAARRSGWTSRCSDRTGRWRRRARSASSSAGSRGRA